MSEVPGPDPLTFVAIAALLDLEADRPGMIQRMIDRIEKGRKLSADVVRLRFWPMGPQVKWSEEGSLALLQKALALAQGG